MTSAELRNLLICPRCLKTFTDPVMLSCGHNFCRGCIDRVLNIQGVSKRYSCPECREEFKDRPALHSNTIVRDIVESFPSAQQEQENTGIQCTYCIHTSVPAVKSCLLCEASLCSSHLIVHSKSQEHMLCDPTTSPEDRKSSLHKKILEYNCDDNSEPVHVSCCLIAIHKGEQVGNEISEKWKKLKNFQENLKTNKEELERRVQGLQERCRALEHKAEGEIKRVIDLFTELRGQLEDLEKRALCEVSTQLNQHCQVTSRLIQQLETKKDELSRRMCQIQELCDMTDQLNIPQEPDLDDLCGTLDGDNEDLEQQIQIEGDLDMAKISHVLCTGLSEVLMGFNGGIYFQEAVDISLDVNSATKTIHVSDNMKTATLLGNQNRSETSETFTFYPQIISKGTFNSGRHYWEVDVRGSHNWKVGVCYPSIQRKGGDRREGGTSGLQEIGYNDKSWVMERWNMEYFMIHDHRRFQIPDIITGDKIRVLLDYEAGQVSFYDVGDPIRHLHTYTATFTEPLHVALLIWDNYGFLTICGGNHY